MTLDPAKQTYLERIYYDPGHVAGYSSLTDLYSFVKKDGKYTFKKSDIETFLQSSEVHTTHVRNKKAKHWYGIITPYPGYMVDIDSGYFDLGKGPYKYVIVGIDTFSRKASAKAVKDLKGKTVKQALISMMDDFGVPVQRYRGDSGTEYRNKTVQSALAEHGVAYVVSHPPHKSNYAERFLQYLKRKLYMSAQHTGDSRWDKNLQAVLDSYNSRKHSALGMAPDEVKKEDIAKLWFKFKKKRLRSMPPPTPYKFEVHDRVRVNYARVPFRKNYLEQNSTIVYYVTSRYSKSNINRYTLKDQLSQPVPGSFTEDQLVLTRVDDDTEYRVEKILRYKNINGVRHALVKWHNYPSKYNSYVAVSQIKDISKKRRKR